MTFFQDSFIARTAPMRVRFGAGVSGALAEEVEALGCSRAVVLSTPGRVADADVAAARLGRFSAGVFPGAVMHTPVDVSEAAVAYVESVRGDCLVSVGGGSTIGLSKAIALRTDLPQVVVPTTYAGSEATAILGQTEGGRKTTLTDPRVQPEVILYDPELVTSLPPRISATSALNAIAHSVEGLYARDRNPISTMLAVEGLRAFRHGLPRVLAAPGDLAGRGETLYAAWLCGTVLGQVGMALHHKLCHALGGGFGLPHAETHAVILPHATAFNARAVPDLLAPVAEIFGEATPGLALHAFAETVGAPLSLKEIGMQEADLDSAADLATQAPYWNPAPVSRDAVRTLLQDAFDGRAPTS